jgi:hypothetical protein
MRIGEIRDIDVVAQAGSVRRGVVDPKDID